MLFIYLYFKSRSCPILGGIAHLDAYARDPRAVSLHLLVASDSGRGGRVAAKAESVAFPRYVSCSRRAKPRLRVSPRWRGRLRMQPKPLGSCGRLQSCEFRNLAAVLASRERAQGARAHPARVCRGLASMTGSQDRVGKITPERKFLSSPRSAHSSPGTKRSSLAPGLVPEGYSEAPRGVQALGCIGPALGRPEISGQFSLAEPSE